MLDDDWLIKVDADDDDDDGGGDDFKDFDVLGFGVRLLIMSLIFFDLRMSEEIFEREIWSSYFGDMRKERQRYAGRQFLVI